MHLHFNWLRTCHPRVYIALSPINMYNAHTNRQREKDRAMHTRLRSREHARTRCIEFRKKPISPAGRSQRSHTRAILTGLMGKLSKNVEIPRSAPLQLFANRDLAKVNPKKGSNLALG